MFEWLWGKKKKAEVKVTNPDKKAEIKSEAKLRWKQTPEQHIVPEFENECDCECDDHDCFYDEDCDECDCHDDEW